VNSMKKVDFKGFDGRKCYFYTDAFTTPNGSVCVLLHKILRVLLLAFLINTN
jgi:hypothetical protein